jgi:hypothetical protein
MVWRRFFGALSNQPSPFGLRLGKPMPWGEVYRAEVAEQKADAFVWGVPRRARPSFETR